ncbi:phage tail family protein [Streptomyces sp. ID05-39B]|uniref:phage tail domain-containing protein n=1 Tax=Streptomyces sp. ID05-39B TaxID=3028664 RepID=UPI0029B70027|nr:phage tail domain-containing protein [Streptomyces sp. ID05-39B]MDX3527135.1 phage tail family protein [Streptomyces sp. ID05-39B]
MQKLYDGIQVDLGDVTLGGVDDSGVGWHIADLEGWYGPQTRTDIAPREADHGAWMGPVYLGERPITLTGVVHAPDRTTLEIALEQLLAACSLTDTDLTVWESTPKRCTVRRSGTPVIKRIGATAASYSLLVTAEDPRRYELNWQSSTTALPSTTGGLILPATMPWTIDATSVSGQIAATNTGSIASRPLFTIAGPVQQPQVSVLYADGTVRALAYADTLNTGDVLTIDTDAHSVMLGTASRRRYLSGQWPEIPPNESVTIAFTAAAYDASALLTAQWRSAWL